ncbi:MAG: hypothetical protein ACTSW4_05800 [Candidatus Ranarchaeia archaeon]
MSAKGNSVLVIGGTGKNGREAVLHLAHNPRVRRIIIGGRNKEAAHGIMANALMSTNLIGQNPRIEFLKMDLMDLEQTSDQLRRIKPDMILQTATGISSFWYVPIIKKAVAEHGMKSYHPGHTVAKDLAMIYLTMKALRKAELTVPIVNLSFPDHTCYILGKIGLAPNCGAGSIAMTVLSSKIVIAKQRNVPLNNVRITMIAHHALRAFDPKEVPYYMKVYVGDEDITPELDTDQVVRDSMKYTLLKVGNTAHTVAASAVSNLLNIYFDTGAFGHCPGPKGLCGGYPVTFNSDTVSPIIPPGITKSRAEEMNIKGMIKDGIERVDSDGTVHFGEGPRKVLEQVLGLSGWKTMKVEECIDMMKDLVNAYQRLAEKQG